MNKLFLCLGLSLGLFSCQPNANDIADQAMEHAGSHLIEGKEIVFTFRDKNYRSVHKEGRYLLERSFAQDSVEIRDVLTNNGFQRFIDETPVQVADSMAVRYENSVNSVHYFAYLPYGLNDDAVNKELIGKVTIKGKPYYKVKVWFDKEGGGTDFEDVFLYWIGTDSYKVDYLAYEYHTNGGGMRFREAFNRRSIDGIDFADHRNFKPAASQVSLYALDSLYNEDALELLSLIELQDVKVAPCETCL